MAAADEGFLDTYLPYVLRQADQALSRGFYEVLTRSGVARSEWRVLAVLEELGELSILDLTAASLTPQPTVTHAVRRLEERGLVTRVLGTDDRRQRFVSITPEGSSITRNLIEEARQLEAEALEESGDLSQLVRRLKDLTAIVEAHAKLRAEEHAHAR